MITINEVVKIDAKICDKCGTTYKNVMLHKVVDGAGRIVTNGDCNKKYTIKQKPDLCDDCQKQLNTILDKFFHIGNLPYDPLKMWQ